MSGPVHKILRVDSSPRSTISVTRAMSDEVVACLLEQWPTAEVMERDVSMGMPCLNEPWITASRTEPDLRTEGQNARLELSDEMVSELKEADVVLIGVPLYNFGIPASLKSWVDLVCRSRDTFRYSEAGPEGLLKNKKAYLLFASNGTPVGAPEDFASRYMNYVLYFLGFENISLIAADEFAENEVAKCKGVRTMIRKEMLKEREAA